MDTLYARYNIELMDLNFDKSIIYLYLLCLKQEIFPIAGDTANVTKQTETYSITNIINSDL